MTPTCSVAEVASALGMSESAIYESVRVGKIPNVAIGRRVAIPRAWLNQHLVEAGITPQPEIRNLEHVGGTFT